MSRENDKISINDIEICLPLWLGLFDSILHDTSAFFTSAVEKRPYCIYSENKLS